MGFMTTQQEVPLSPPTTEYGRWTVVGPFEYHIQKNGKPQRVLPCKCSCGTFRKVPYSRLLSGTSQSCGCLRNEQTAARNMTHGLSHERCYFTWKNMMNRCYKPGVAHYEDYGGRGISVCPEWHDVETFIGWAKSSGYQEHLTIDRIDTNGNYSPSNCRWITQKEQSLNTRRSRRLTIHGETKTTFEWAEDPRCVVSEHVFKSRITRKWDPLRALTEPSDESKSRVTKTNREYVVEVLTEHPGLSFAELYPLVLEAGAVFRSKDPEQSLNSTLQSAKIKGILRSEGAKPTRYYLA